MQKTRIENINFVFSEGDYETATKYDLSIKSSDTNLMHFTKECIIFEGNKFILTPCEKFIILECGLELIYLWTTLKGSPQKIKLSSLETLYDILIMSYSKKADIILGIGNSFECALACWRNARNADVIEFEENKYFAAIESFKQATIQGQLIF